MATRAAPGWNSSNTIPLLRENVPGQWRVRADCILEKLVQGVILEQLRVADIAVEHGMTAVAGNLANLPIGCTVESSGGAKPARSEWPE